MQPNQLETLAKAESRTDIGRVLSVSQGLTVVTGINSDAPVGATVDFSCGAKGVLLRWHSKTLCFVLLLAGEDLVGKGDGAQCTIKGVLQVVDEEEGAQTKPEYEMFQVPVGERMIGAVVDHLGVPRDGRDKAASLGPPCLPLLNEQVSMHNREVISEPLMLGVKCIDVLTPMARGSALLMAGAERPLQTQLALDAIRNLRGSGVRCVYAAVGCSDAELEGRLRALRDAGAMDYTTVVAVPQGAMLGRQYAAMCTAVSIGEHVRNEGGAALVVLDPVESMLHVWEALLKQVVQFELPGSGDSEEREEGESDSSDEAFDLVEYEGMLVSVAAAQRRQFFSALMQRAAKMHRRFGGGTLSLLMALQGEPATGVRRATAPSLAKYKHLSAAQKAKLAAVLAASQAADASRPSAAQSGASSAPAGVSDSYARTEVLEELMSISDGQMVVKRADGDQSQAIELDFRQSLSRMGSRAYYPALQDLAPQVRLDLAQADDAELFGGSLSDSQQAVRRQRAAVTRAALLQPTDGRAPLPEQVSLLWALQKGYLDDVAPERVSEVWGDMWSSIQSSASEAVEEIGATKKLTASSKRQLSDACDSFVRSKV